MYIPKNMQKYDTVGITETIGKQSFAIISQKDVYFRDFHCIVFIIGPHWDQQKNGFRIHSSDHIFM